MPSHHDSSVFVDSGCVAFSGLRSPPLLFVTRSRNIILNVFISCLDHCFFDDFSYFRVEGWQSLLLVVVNVEYLLVF